MSLLEDDLEDVAVAAEPAPAKRKLSRLKKVR